MKKAAVISISMILMPTFFFFFSVFWYSGGNTFWEKIDYFPLASKKIISLEPFGDAFWIEGNDNFIYQISYPCSQQEVCWSKSEITPLAEQVDTSFVFTEDGCENSQIMYPLFHKIKSCVTSKTYVADATFAVSLALTEDSELWIWRKPWIDPFTVLFYMGSSTVAGIAIGFIFGGFLALKIK